MPKVIMKGHVIEEKHGKITIDGHNTAPNYHEFRTLAIGCIIGWLIVLSVFIGVNYA